MIEDFQTGRVSDVFENIVDVMLCLHLQMSYYVLNPERSLWE